MTIPRNHSFTIPQTPSLYRGHTPFDYNRITLRR